MTDVIHENALPLWRRLIIYQSERFPLIKNGLLIAAFAAASINVSAFLGGRSLPELTTYAATWLIVLILFFQMRAADEWKDLEVDKTYRPERAVPRGLVSLKLILGIAIGLIPVAMIAAFSVTPSLLVLLGVTWVWLALMTVEFFVPKWLKARAIPYLVSHMLIMPLIDLLATGAEWLVAGDGVPDSLWIFLVLSFVNGCVIEFGRKLYATENEGPGIETYSANWGPKRAAMAWAGSLTISYVLLLMLAWRLDTIIVTAIFGGIGYLVSMFAAYSYAQAQTPKNQSHTENAAGIWVLVCYLLAGFAPLLTRLLP